MVVITYKSHMLQLPHTTMGLLLAETVQSPLAIPLAFISHFILDTVPHWDFFTNGKELLLWRKLAILIDFILSLILGILYCILHTDNYSQVVIALSCCVAANLPDVLEIPYFLGWQNKLTSYVLKVQSFLHWRAQLPWGLLPQLLLVFFGIFFLFFARQ